MVQPGRLELPNLSKGSRVLSPLRKPIPPWLHWLRGWDSNPRPPDYESGELPLLYPAIVGNG